MVHTRMKLDPWTKQMGVLRTQNVEPILLHNQRLYNELEIRALAHHSDFVRVCSIPNIVVEQMMDSGIDLLKDDDALEYVVRLIQSDPEFAHFRTARGRAL